MSRWEVLKNTGILYLCSVFNCWSLVVPGEQDHTAVAREDSTESQTLEEGALLWCQHFKFLSLPEQPMPCLISKHCDARGLVSKL
jgi:hypothetical protein